jgi:hypothetical protein
MEAYGTEALMMFCWAASGKIIHEIDFASCPENFGVALFCFISYPVESHIDESRSLLVIDRGISNATCSGVVRLDGCCLVGIAHFLECVAKDFAFFHVDEEFSYFGFRSRWHDVLDDAGDGEDCSIVEDRFGCIGFCS